MNLSGLSAVAVGAVVGAWLRWWLGVKLNPILPELPIGTLAANLSGGYIIGLAIAFFAQNTSAPPEARLFIITGFLGALTTFSTFSAEVVTMFQRTQYQWALIAVAAHLAGSLFMTAMGIITINLIYKGAGGA
jgi:CrcB protein